MPPETRTASGEERRVGLELEFAGVGLEDVAYMVQRLAGGKLERLSRFEFRVDGTEHGAYGVEFDALPLKNRSYAELARELGIEMSEPVLDNVDDLLARVAGIAVPVELVTPPLPFSQLSFAGEIEEALRKARAEGTGSSPIYAFGMQLNPECVELTGPWLASVMQSFLLLYGWLKKEIRVDFTRRLSPYVDPFPPEYARHILQPGYAPDFANFADDYLRFNPTRNRPLDLLPVLAEVDEDRVRAVVGEEHKVNKRPALHYRLPNCRIDEPDWHIALEWQRWVAVEELAHDHERRAAMARAYLKRHPGGVEEWLEDLAEWFDA